MQSKTRFAKLIIIIGSFLLIAAIAYLLLNQKSEKNSSDQTSSITPSHTPVPTTNVTADWIEKKRSFYSFKYPPNWVERKADTYGVFIIGPADEETALMRIEENVYPDATPENLIKKALGKEEAIISQKEIVVGGHRAVLIEIRSFDMKIKSQVYVSDVLQDKTRKGTQVIFMTNNSEENKKIFDQILQTFQYTNQ